MNQALGTSVLALIALIWAGSSTAQVRDQEGCTRDYGFTRNQAVIRWQLTDEERVRRSDPAPKFPYAGIPNDRY